MKAFERCLVVLAVVASCFGFVHSALAQSSKSSCVAAFEDGQRQQLQGELARAIDQFTRCAASTCPARVRDECQSFLETARGAMPGVLLAPVDAASERPLDGVSVSVDGAEGRAFDGRMLRMEPGEHQVIFQRSGYVPIRLHLTMRASDPPRLVPLRFTPAPNTPGAKLAARSKSATSVAPGEDLPRPTPSISCAPLEPQKPPLAAPLPAPPARSILRKEVPPGSSASLGGGRRAAVLAAAVVGGVGAVGFAYFGLTARSADEGLDACTPHCEPSAVDAIKRDYVLANVSLGVGVVGALTASVLWLTSPRVSGRPESASSRRGWAVSVGPVTTVATRF
jgi:hypothetical protein